MRLWMELRLYQSRDNALNRSDLRLELWVGGEAGDKGEGFTIHTNKTTLNLAGWRYEGKQKPSDYTTINLKAGENLSKIFALFTTEEPYIRQDNNVYDYNFKCAHNLDGSFDKVMFSASGTSWNYVANKFNVFNIEAKAYVSGSANDKYVVFDGGLRFEDYILPVDRAIYPVTAVSFTDEENPSFTYAVSAGYCHNASKMRLVQETVDYLQVALSFDGVNADIPYRDIPINGTSYTFDLTDGEREIIRQKAQGSSTVPIYYLTKTVRSVTVDSWQSMSFMGATERQITIVGCEPQLSPTVKDIHGRANYLTGSKNKFIKYVSIAEFTTGAVASKHATIVNQSVINGSQTVENLYSGTIDGVDSNTFYFAATDSRGLTARDAIVVDLVPYIKLTARISKATLNTDGELSFTVTGNYFNGSFGARGNSLQFEYGMRENNGDINWVIFEAEPTFNGNTYTINHTITGLNYRNAFTIIVNVIDEITSIQTEPKTVVAIPVFDWSANDFKHNTNVAFANNKSINGIKTNGAEVSIFEPCNADNSTVLNYSGFADRDRDTAIFGNTVKLISNNPVEINGKNYGENRVLWGGVSHMNANQSINLSEAVSAQPNGIVLVFSLYRNNAAEDVSINTAFISKQQVALLSGAPHSFFMLVNAGFSILGAKYLYIDDTTIRGHEGNTLSGANNGITFNNSNYVLRYVIGV